MFSSLEKPVLDGLRVLDLSRFIAGPYCGMLLGDFGADVVKIERIGGGDDSRAVFPQVNGESLYYLVFNRNKRSVALDLRDPAAQATIRELAAKADVVIENFRPGTMEKMGCGYDELSRGNPGLIMARVSGFGQTGPLAHVPCFDSIAQAMSGLMDLTGDADGPPMAMGSFVVDYASGLYTTIGILMALQQRARTGKGQVVDACLLDSAMSLLLTAIPAKAMLGEETGRIGNQDRYVAPGNVYRTADGKWIKIVAGGDAIFPRVAEALAMPGLVADPRFATLADRIANRADIDAIVGGWVLARNAAEALAVLERHAIPAAVIVRAAEVIDNPQVAHRQSLMTFDHPRAGRVTMQGVPFMLSDTPGGFRRPPPALGEHNDEILAEWLGYSAEQLSAVHSSRAI